MMVLLLLLLSFPALPCIGSFAPVKFPKIVIATTKSGVKLCASPGGPHPCDCLHHLPSGARIEKRRRGNRIHLPNGTVIRHKRCQHKHPARPKPPTSSNLNSSSPDTSASACSSINSGYYHGRPFNAEHVFDGSNITRFAATLSVPASPEAPVSGDVESTTEFLFYWFGLQDTRDDTTPVLQPVLSYSASGSPNAARESPIWYFMSWNCCPNGHKYSADGVPVSGPGVSVQGVVDCTAGGSCSVTSTDSSGKTSALTLNDDNNGASSWDWALVELETYGIKGCGSYGGGSFRLTDGSMTSASGQTLVPRWINDPYLQILPTATKETLMSSSFSACCGGSMDMGWPSLSIHQN